MASNVERQQALVDMQYGGFPGTLRLQLVLGPLFLQFGASRLEGGDDSK